MGLAKRKQFVAMAGNIGCGKTTAAKMISHSFNYELFDEPVVDNRFLGEYYKDMKRWSFTLQLEFLIKRVQHHELIYKVSKSCIQDRTLYEDPEVFAKYLHGLGNMSNVELDLYFEYFTRLNRNLHTPDKVIFLTVPQVDTLLQRIQRRGRSEEGSIASPFLEGLNCYYQTLPSVLKAKYGIDVLKVDVTNTDIREGEGKIKFLDEVSSFLAR